MVFELSIATWQFWQGKIPLWMLFEVVARFYPMAAIIIVSSFCWIVSMMLESIANQNQRHSFTSWQKELLQWKLCYLTIVELVDKLSACFGSAILIVLTCAFVRLVNFSFSIIMIFKMNIIEWSSPLVVIPYVCSVLIVIICSFFLSYAGHKIQKKVNVAKYQIH